jgi:predicted transcriptional regulator
VNVDFQRVVYNYFPYIRFLPKAEQEIISYFNKGMKQKTIGILMGTTQGAVSSRLQRIKKRLILIRECKNFKINDEDLDRFGTLNKTILKIMSETTCQTETAVKVNALLNLSGHMEMNQIKVRHRYEKCLKELEKLAKSEPTSEYPRYLEFFTLIKNNLYVLHELKLDRKSVV